MRKNFAKVMSMLVRLVICFLLTSACTKTMQLKSIDDFPAYDKLIVFYKTVFAKDSAVFDATLLKAIDAETSMALKNKTIPADKVDEITRLQHKLRNLIYYGSIVASLPPREIRKKKVYNPGLRNDFTSLILERIRDYPIQEITYHDQTAKMAERSVESVTPHEKQELYRRINSEAEILVRKAMVRFAYYFPFRSIDYYKLCLEQKGAHCADLQTGLDFKFTGEKFQKLDSVVALINNSINKLNRVATGLARVTQKFQVNPEGRVILNPNLTKGLIVTRLNEDSPAVQQYMGAYEYILLGLADKGITPIFFTSAFAKNAGAVYLNETVDWLGVGELSYRQLSHVTPTTVSTALAEIQDKLIKHWIHLKSILASFEQKKFNLSEREIFNSIMRNDVIVGGLLAKEHQHAVPVVYLIDKFQDERKDPRMFTAIYDLVTAIEIFSMVGLFSSMWSGVGLSIFIIPLVAANFAWAGIHSAQALLSHNRYLALERSVIVNTTAQMSEVMESLRAAKRTRVHAILMGTVGLGMNIPSMNYVLKHIYDGKKVFMVDMAASIFAMPDPAGAVESPAVEQLNRY